MKPTSEHFEIVKYSKKSPSPKSSTRPVFKSSSQSQSKEKFCLNSKLQKLKQIIDTNKIEYTLTACVLLTFQMKGKSVLSKNEIIDMTKKEIQENPNKVFIIKAGQKEMVNLKNFSKRINILLNRSHYINKTVIDEGNFDYSINLKLVDIKYESILKDIITLKNLPISKVVNDDKNKNLNKSKNDSDGNNTELIELRENEKDEDKNKIDLSDAKQKKKKRKMKSDIEDPVKKFNKKNFELNNIENGKTSPELNNNENKNNSKQNNIGNKNNNNDENNKNNNNSKKDNNEMEEEEDEESNDINTNIDMINNENNNFENNKKFNIQKGKTNIENNINNSKINTNNISNKNSNIKSSINNKKKIINDENENNINDKIDENKFIIDVYLLEKDNILSELINRINNNPNESKEIIESNQKIIQNDIKTLEKEINFRKEQIKKKNEELFIIKTNQNLFKKYEYKGIKSLATELKTQYEDYINNIKILEHNKEIIKLLKNDNSYKILLIQKYKDLEEICIKLYQKIYDKLTTVLEEYKNLENIINVLYKDNKNKYNIFKNEIEKLSDIKERNDDYSKSFINNLKKKLDIIINDNKFKEYINEEEKKLCGEKENKPKKEAENNKKLEEEYILPKDDISKKIEMKKEEAITNNFIKDKFIKKTKDKIKPITQENPKDQSKLKIKEKDSVASKELDKENTSIESKDKDIKEKIVDKNEEKKKK